MKNITLSEIISMEPSLHRDIKVSPENYFDILRFAEIANKNKDVEIVIDTDMVIEKYLDSSGFYGVEIVMLRKTQKPNGVMRYFICCNNAIRA
jgi:hypothetical protein